MPTPELDQAALEEAVTAYCQARGWQRQEGTQNCRARMEITLGIERAIARYLQITKPPPLPCVHPYVRPGEKCHHCGALTDAPLYRTVADLRQENGR